MPDRTRATSERIVAELERAAPLTRRELATHLDLPVTTVTSAVERLLVGGTLREHTDAPGRTSGRGRPPRHLVLAARQLVAVIVVGHRTLEAAVVTLDGVIETRAARPFDPRSADDVVGPGVALLEEAWAGSGLDRDEIGAAVLALPRPYRAGAGSPWPSRSSVRDVGAPVPGWLADDPAPALAEALGVPALAENDANLAALGEIARGAAIGLDDVLYVDLVPGFGAGVVAGGQLVHGRLGFAGELGHVQVDEHGPLCVCGNRGCLIRVATVHHVIEQLRPTYPASLTFEDVVGLAEAEDPDVHRVLADLGRTLAPILATACLVLDPQAIVVDGSLGAGSRAVVAGVRERIERALPRRVFEELVVVPGSLADQAELVGAAALASRERLVHTPRRGRDESRGAGRSVPA
ncbi:ROK family protein [Luteimicrobium sp. DT211]|uniref:ROK family transcriptional regulator n=1 Tax=Luteimicrobium sp. DT211 TaxID=3393412 RepID=UPI003CFB9C46